MAAEAEEIRGDVDLFALHGLAPISRTVLSGGVKQQDYLKGIPGTGVEFRKGPGLELAPVAELHPATVRPELAPLTKAQLEALTFQPGRCALTEAEKGVPVATALGGAAGLASGGSSGRQPGGHKKRKPSREPA